MLPSVRKLSSRLIQRFTARWLSGACLSICSFGYRRISRNSTAVIGPGHRGRYRPRCPFVANGSPLGAVACWYGVAQWGERPSFLVYPVIPGKMGAMSAPSFVTFSINAAPSLMPFRVFRNDFSADGLGCGASRTFFIAAIALFAFHWLLGLR